MSPVSTSGLEQAAWADLAFPLCEFYARAGLPAPRVEVVRGETMPFPWRRLLVHDQDMTPTLEAHYGCEIHIEVLSREQRGDTYFREVILRLDRDNRAVEFGASRISLELVPPLVRRLVLQEQLPIGHILKAHEIAHSGRPRGFFRVQADALMAGAFGLSTAQMLYGRRNTLWDAAGRPMCEVVEILPP